MKLYCDYPLLVVLSIIRT